MKWGRCPPTADERRQLRGLIAAGTGGGPARTNDRIAGAVEVSTGDGVRQRFVGDGSEAAPVREKAARPPVPPDLDGRAEAQLVTPARSSPPGGRVRRARQPPTGRSSRPRTHSSSASRSQTT